MWGQKKSGLCNNNNCVDGIDLADVTAKVVAIYLYQGILFKKLFLVKVSSGMSNITVQKVFPGQSYIVFTPVFGFSRGTEIMKYTYIYIY